MCILPITPAASRSDNRTREPVFYNFTTNAAPVNGTCEINPRLGYPNETLFNITCSEFEDPDAPVNYSLYFEYGGTSVVYFTIECGNMMIWINAEGHVRFS